MLRAVIFDMGDTLLRFARPGTGSWRDAETPGIRNLFRYLLEQSHPIATQEDAFVEVMFDRLVVGWEQATGGHLNLRASDWIASVAQDHALALDEAALREAVHHYARPMRDGVSMVPGADTLLAQLRERGLRVGLISNTIWPAELHLEDLAEFGLLPQIEHAVFSGDLGLWKPNPAVFQHVLAALEVAPAEAVFVGDNLHEDIGGAHAAGLRGVWLRNDQFPDGDAQPDAVIGTLPELLPVLERWSGS